MKRIPTGTYRLQLHRGFGFTDAARIVPYLADLGVSHVYCSPVLQAAPDSQHGYDVVDHTQMSDDLGGADGWRRLAETCHHHGLGLVVDIVPNHMAIPVPERLNRPLWDVLTRGAESSYAGWFDIDWTAGAGKLLMAVLGRPLEECVRDGEVVVDPADDVIRYFEHEFPLAPGTDTLDAQHYRLAHWRTANSDLNYRRFFDVTSLIGVRVERPETFDATHALMLRLVRHGDVDGLRIDHPDGLADPGGYLERLRATAGDVWTVVEKILEGDEELPATWQCDGTTGYDAIFAINSLLTDPAGEKPLTELYADLTGRRETYADVVAGSKRLAVERSFVAEVDRLVRELGATDFTEVGLREAIVELLVQFPVYRAYDDDPAGRKHIEAATAAATQALPARRDELQWLEQVLLGDAAGNAAFVTRFGQTTGPATAKGVEDTAFYRYLRLVALNEVGGDPGVFGRPTARWHEFCRRLADEWPATMTTLSTHDTKRSEDVRARLLVLAEIPDEWAVAVTRWHERLDAADAPKVDANAEYLLWQTLVGAWPIDEERLSAYMGKATREAKEQTSWTDPDETFDVALRELVRHVLTDRGLIDDIAEWMRTHVKQPARSNSLAQKLLQLMMPGVPDVYQGQELPDLSLVDPDNRRPVDYDLRTNALSDLATADPKLRITATALRLRRERPDVFSSSYQPLEADGTAASHAVAFGRGGEVVTVVTRLPAGLARHGGWGETTITLPKGNWRNMLTGRAVDGPGLSDMLGDLPVALLTREVR